MQEVQSFGGPSSITVHHNILDNPYTLFFFKPMPPTDALPSAFRNPDPRDTEPGRKEWTQERWTLREINLQNMGIPDSSSMSSGIPCPQSLSSITLT